MSLAILGTGSALPALVMENDDLRAYFDTSDEWITSRTGIRRRHIMVDETVTDLALRAATLAMADAKTQPATLDYILCATLGGDYITPSLACILQSRLEARCPALDVNAACTGFLYALDVAAALFARGGCHRILLVAAEGLSRLLDWEDRSTAVLFGDGAGAVVLGPGQELEYLRLTSHGVIEPLNIKFPRGTFPGRPAGGGSYVRMDGAEVYKFAVNAIVDGVRKALDEKGLEAGDIDHLVLHQANIRIIDAACRKLGIPPGLTPTNIQEVGNLSAASIPVLLDQCRRRGLFSPGQLLALGGFGGGLTTGTALLRWGLPAAAAPAPHTP